MPEALKKTTGTMVTFGDVVQLSKERSQSPAADGFDRYIGLEHLKPSDLKVRSWGDISDGVTFTSVFRPGQVLFGKRRAYQRKVAVAEFSGVCSGDIYVLEPNGDQLIPELLPYICQSEPFYDYVISMSQGGLSPRVNWKALAKYEFALPALEEQRHAFEVCQASNANVEAHRKVLSAIRQLSASYGVGVLRKYPEKLVEVGEVAKFTSGKQVRVSGLPQEPSPEAPIPVYGGNGISGYVDVPLDDCLSPTVVIGRVGQFCGVTFLTDGPAWITDNALYPKTIEPDVDARFLAMCLAAANLNKGKLGEYLPLVTQRVVHSARIPRLSESVQQQHVEKFSTIELRLVETENRLAESIELHKQILAHVLSKRNCK